MVTRLLNLPAFPKGENMGLNPSNAISKQITGRQPFPNVAGMGDDDPKGVDAILRTELEKAGITVTPRTEDRRQEGGEPQSIIVGALHEWEFERAWYYWTARGPGIPLDDATALHNEHGTSVRVGGHCGCPPPTSAVKSYHIDNQAGLNALAETLRTLHER